MKIFITILLTMFIGACTGNTNNAEKSANSSKATTKGTPLPFQPPGVKASSADSARKAVLESVADRLDEELVKEGLVEKEKQQEVPTINITPEAESDNVNSDTKVPEKE